MFFQNTKKSIFWRPQCDVLILGKNTTITSQCEPNPNSAYKNFSNNCYTKIVNGVAIQVACSKPIVKTTATPSTSTFLRTQYFKNKIL